MHSLRLLGLVVALLVGTAIVSPAIAWLTVVLGFDFSFARLWNRVFEVSLALALVLRWRWLGLGGLAGVGLRREGALRPLGLGLVAGLCGVGVGLVLCWLGGALVPELRFEPGKTVWKAALGLGAAVLVGVGEETLFRGVLLRRFVNDAGRGVGVVATTAVYAVVHALRTGSGPRGAVEWTAGWERLPALFAPLAGPEVLPGVVGLFALGLMLAWLRLRTGSLWMGIGVHAAWVAVFRVGRLFFEIKRRPQWLIGPGWPPLVGGAAGVVAIVVTACVAAVLVRRLTRRRA
jgi:membrane protease YdiL (CAAX protease family)